VAKTRTKNYYLIDPYGEKKYSIGKSSKKGRSISDWEDKKQDQYLKYLESIREKEKNK
jgi:hypothetical protein